MDTTSPITNNLETLLATASAELDKAHIDARNAGKLPPKLRNKSIKALREASETLSQVIALCEANGIEVK
jgi:hypothetical protein